MRNPVYVLINPKVWVQTLLVLSFLLVSHVVLAHHWVADVYDADRRFIIEAEVRNFRLMNPHPFLQVTIQSFPNGQETEGFEIGQEWTLEMDNLWELTGIGFEQSTFVEGDRILVAVDPIRMSGYRANTMYLRALQHYRLDFVYVHNVTQLFPVEGEDEHLSRHLEKIR